tara:strand:+ start:1650 stop:2492 length:843 start_codon:yes stop_codon:yes gene_type:complete
VNYFLKKFPSTEWSGPAWYKPHFKKGERFPKGFTLMHFHPVDLGHGTATTIEAGDTAKILEYTWKNYPETEKCMMGIIHSHHTMGAFFSGTDTNCIEDNSPIKNFYCSTVVASQKDRFAFAFGYLDQYERHHLIEAETKDIKVDMPKTKEEPKWARIAKKLKDRKKEEPTVIRSYNRGRFQQTSLAFGHGYPINYESVDQAYSSNPDVSKIEEIRLNADAQDDPDSAYIQLLYEAFSKAEIQYDTFREEIEDYGMNPNVIVNELNKEDLDVKLLPETSTQ